MEFTVPTPLFVALWVALMTLGVLVIIMYRQLAVLLEIKLGHRRTTAADLAPTLAAGQYLPAFTGRVIAPADRPFSWSAPNPQASLFMVADPLCGSCERGVLTLNALAASGDLAGVAACIITTENAALVNAVEAFRESRIPVVHVATAVSRNGFGIRAMPFLFAVEPDGRVATVSGRLDERIVAGMVHQLESRRVVDDLRPVPMAAPQDG